MDKTKMYFSKTDPLTAKTPAEKNFAGAAWAFDRLDFKEQWQWQERVIKRNPRLEQFLQADAIH